MQLTIENITVYDTQYKAVEVQWFAGVWFSLQHSCRWTSTKPENPPIYIVNRYAQGLDRDVHLIMNKDY